MFEKFTERARKVMSLGRQEAQRLNSEFIGTEHMLLGIVQEGGGLAARVLKGMNVSLDRLKEQVEKLLPPSTSPVRTLGQLPFSPRAKHVIELAGDTASQLGHDVIGTEHLLLGLLKEQEGIAAQVLIGLGLKTDEVLDTVLSTFGVERKNQNTCGRCGGTGREPLDQETQEIYQALFLIVRKESPAFSAKHEGARVLEEIARAVKVRCEEARKRGLEEGLVKGQVNR